ncbi:HAMP domain-containing protein [Youhaiella tibetensis]|uniref:HAMP domain-containing protein n=1 Tax=Paradevosia tibetensis TaxID=1447062 RepID=A0A5B9DIX6_9HYPH|nr:methyl-accepting chemotaxis protein [Youhaiella tibetensis]QEE18688.1 HAMP domain-containing protein [Youhaiella tibetensis]
MRIKSLPVKVSLFAGIALAAVFAVGMTVLVQRVGTTVESQTLKLQDETTSNVSAEVSSRLQAAARIAQNIASTMSGLRESGVTDRAAYDALLEKLLADSPAILATWSAWQPNALDGRDAEFAGQSPWDATGRYVPYWNRGSGKIIEEMLADYDTPGPGDYALLPKNLDRAVAIEPYPYMVAGQNLLITSFGVPIKVDGKYAGTAGIDLALADVNQVVSAFHPFDTGRVMLISGTGIAVSHPDPAVIGQKLPDSDPIAAIAKQAIASGNRAQGEATGADGAVWRFMAAPINAGGTEDKWAVVSMVPAATLSAAVNEARWTIVALSALCVLAAAAIVFGLMKVLVGKPLNRLGDTVEVMAAGNYEVTVPGTERIDEIGTLSRAVEVFRENGLKVAQMTEAEAVRIIADKEARTRMMGELRDAFGNVVNAAVEGDFTRRVDASFPDAELNDIASSINNLVTTVDRGLSETGEVLSALAETNLTRRVEGQYQGAFARLKGDTNAVADKLTEIVGQLKATSQALKTATGEILSGANDLSERTTKQAATIEETSAAMEQLATTVLQNANRAKDASDNAADVTRTAEQGGQVMGQANEAMERIETSSSKISNIIGMIDDIAFQTNLLALNASVEAARAGEAGKGFAVVAVEVRRLAQSAAEASAEVKALIEQSAIEVQGGTKLVADAAAKLAAMLEGVRANNSLMDGIARESREQASAIEEVTTAVRQMDEMTQHNAALVEEINAAIEQTESQATELDGIVTVFTLTDGERTRFEPAARATAPRALPGKLKQAAKSYLSNGNAAISADWDEF